MIDPSTAGAAVGLANSAYTAVKSAFDLGKKISDLDLKKHLSDAVDDVLELKMKVHELAEENRTLRQQIEQQANLRRNAANGLWFKDDDELSPLCPKCYESEKKFIYLTHNRRSEYSSENYMCKVCKFQHYPR